MYMYSVETKSVKLLGGILMIHVQYTTYFLPYTCSLSFCWVTLCSTISLLPTTPPCSLCSYTMVVRSHTQAPLPPTWKRTLCLTPYMRPGTQLAVLMLFSKTSLSLSLYLSLSFSLFHQSFLPNFFLFLCLSPLAPLLLVLVCQVHSSLTKD